MDRRTFLQNSALSLFATSSFMAKLSFATKAKQRPNIILIMADDIGSECFGSYGGLSYSTPALDEMAANGVRFDYCFAQPLCTPSRVEIMTGKYNFRNYKAFGILDPKERTFAHLLQSAGYKTCVAGKWQLYGTKAHGKWQGKGTLPQQAGFDEYCLWQIEKKGSRYADPLIQKTNEPARVYKDQYGPDVFCDFILNFMQRHQSQTFFIYYPMVLVHAPFVPTPDSPEWKTNRNERDKKYFVDMVIYMDKIVGRIIEEVKALGIEDKTLILFTGDNGTDRNIISQTKKGSVHGQKGYMTNAGTRVPLIGYWKGKTAKGKVNHDLIDFTDFYPTLAQAAGAQLPRDKIVDGKGFFPQLLGEKGDPREWVYCHYDPHWGKFKPGRFARNHRWKLYSDGRLYDVKNDPLEQRPLKEGEESKKEKQARRQLKQILDRMPANLFFLPE